MLSSVFIQMTDEIPKGNLSIDRRCAWRIRLLEFKEGVVRAKEQHMEKVLMNAKSESEVNASGSVLVTAMRNSTRTSLISFSDVTGRVVGTAAAKIED